MPPFLGVDHLIKHKLWFAIIRGVLTYPCKRRNLEWPCIPIVVPFQDELVGRPGGWRSGFCIARHEPKSLIISRAIIGGTKYNSQTYPLQITHRFRLLSAPDFVHILVCAHISIYLKLKTINIDVNQITLVQIYFPGRMIPSYLAWNHFMVSVSVNLCWRPIFDFLRRRWVMEKPGRFMTT